MSATRPEAPPATSPPSGTRPAVAPSLVLEVVVLVLCVPLWIATSEWTSSVGGPGPAFYPRLLIGLLALVLLIRVATSVRAMVAPGRAPEETPSAGGEAEDGQGPIDLWKVAVAAGLAALYVWGSLWIGWVIATFLLVVTFLFVAGKRNPLVVLPTAAVLSVGMAYLFVKVVYISLPTGVGIFDTATFGLLQLLGAA